jgi:threonine synthase
MVGSNAYVCTTCGQHFPLETREWRCSCGGFFDLETWPVFDVTQIDPARPGLWRYRALMPLEASWLPVSLGEGDTPLIPADWLGQHVHLKLESLAPTGSFKDRGAAVLVTALSGLGVEKVVEDSSGNAGAALAAYAARVGIGCEVCVPAQAGGPKLAQMRAHGAEVIEIRGRREYATLAAWAAAAHGATYASHIFNPYFLVGIETLAYELWQQLGGCAPGALVLPVGNGTLLLGAYQGFVRLRKAGLISHLPRIYGVQAAACAPIYQAFAAQRDSVEPVSTAPTCASGIAIGQPARGAQILAALRATNGASVAVSEEEIRAAWETLARRGMYVEETSASAVAALEQLREPLRSVGEEPVVVPITGHGLKTSSSP